MTILFLCTGNSCRSQMAEGFCNYYHKGKIDAFSAGIEKHGLNPNAVKVMFELGIDISNQRSKLITEIDESFDYVVTLCSHANHHCPVFPAKIKVIHQGFDDPVKITHRMEDEEIILNDYRRVRDEIKSFILKLP